VQIPATASVPAHTIHHTIFLLGVAADSPARQKLAAWPGVAAYLPCGWCLFQGHRLEGSTAMRFAGYSQDSEQDLLGRAACKVGDPSVQLSNSQQKARARAVEAGQITPKFAGCNGYSTIAKAVSYISYGDLWLVPIYHAGKTSLFQAVDIDCFYVCHPTSLS
jgi:hypothetical protein